MAVQQHWPPPPPTSWGPIVKDYASALRAALNFVAWQLALKNVGNTRDPIKRTQFPIWETLPDYQIKGKGQVRDILPAALPDIERFQPYNRKQWPETHLLTLLRELSDKTSHRILFEPKSVPELILPPKATILVTLSLHKPVVISRPPVEMRDLKEQLAPYFKMPISIEIPAASPSVYDIKILDAIHQFVHDDVIPRFTGFF